MARPKGSPNKATGLFREALEQAAFSIPDKCIDLYEQLAEKPFLRLRLLELMATYAYPKPKPVDEDGNTDDAARSFLMGIPSEVLIEALRLTQERKEKPA